jgi:hypothetical protein
MADTKELLIKLTLENDKLKSELGKTQKKFKELTGQQKKTKLSLSSLKAGYIAVAGVLTGVVATALGKSIKLASDFEEANSKFGVVFRGVSKEANAMRKELVNAYGVSTIEATKMLSGIQDFLVPMGIARDEAADLSGEFSKLAVDIGSFNNMPTAQVMDDIKSAMSGMSLPMRKYGVDVSETTLKQMALDKGMKLTNGKIDRQSRAMLILEKITKDSSDAVGDFARTQDSFANVMKRAGAIGEDVALIFGQEMQNAMRPMVDAFSEFIDQREGLEKIRKAIQVLFIVGKVAFVGLKSSVIGFIAPIVVLTKAFIGLGKAIKEGLTGGFKAAKESLKETLKSAKELGVNVAKGFKDNVLNIADDIKNVFSETGKTIEGMDDIIEDSTKKREKAEENAAATAQARKEREQEFQELLKARIALQEEINVLNEEQELTELERIEQKRQQEQEFQDFKKNLNQEDLIDKQRVEVEKLQAEKQRLEQSFNLTKFFESQKVQATRSALSDIAGLTSSTNKTLFKIGKATSIANAIINNAEAITKTMTEVPFPLNIPLAIGQAAAGAVQINKISNTRIPTAANGGVIDRVMPASIRGEDGIIGVQRGESVLTRDATTELGRNTINALNEGRGITNDNNIQINVTTNNPEQFAEDFNTFLRANGGARDFPVG